MCVLAREHVINMLCARDIVRGELGGWRLLWANVRRPIKIYLVESLDKSVMNLYNKLIAAVRSHKDYANSILAWSSWSTSDKRDLKNILDSRRSKLLRAVVWSTEVIKIIAETLNGV